MNKEPNRTKHDRFVRIEQSYALLEINMDIVIKDEGIQAWENPIITHWGQIKIRLIDIQKE